VAGGAATTAALPTAGRCATTRTHHSGGSMTHRLITAAIALAANVVASTASAACTSPAEAGLVHRSLKQRLRCDSKALRAGPAACTVTTPPACADTLVGDAAALAYGANHPAPAAVDARALR